MDKKIVPLYKSVEIYASAIGSNYRDIRRCRDDLLDFMDANEWFGQPVWGKGDEIYLERMDDVYEKLDLWLRAYGHADDEKLELLINSYREFYPKTCELYSDYIRESGVKASAALRTLDYILSSIDKEVVTFGDDEIQTLIGKAGEYLGREHMELLIGFLESLKKNGLHTVWKYKTGKPRATIKDNTAYTIDEFSRIAYWVFSEEAWESQGLIRKAAVNRKCADLWLFVALHFVCALRVTDMVRLPEPILPEEASILKDKILKGTFTDIEAETVTDGWMFLIETLAMKPNKTSARGGIPDIKVFIPQSLKKAFGIILVLADSHHKPGTPFVNTYAECRMIEMFFGEDCAEVVGSRYFRSRKANKTFLQGIEAVTDSETARPKGYMLAALARSHKGGIGSLPDTTDIYLKDENFTGYKPEFIIREMFERGIFGFIPVMLLEAYAGKQFRELGVAGQTQLIKDIGLQPKQIEDLTRCIRDSMNKAEQLVAALLVDDSKTQLEHALQLIAVESVPSKQPELCCARIAMGYQCNYPDRSSCIGCGYEVYTKSALQILMEEYRNILIKAEQSSGFERNRLRMILKEGILPAVTQIVTSIPFLYPETDMAPMEEILERGIRYAAIESD